MQIFDNLLQKVDDDPASIRQMYDEWAGDYDATLAEWGYDAPDVGVAYLSRLADKTAPVLDAGCGTGLVGQKLKAAGFGDLFGVDLSEDSLKHALATGAYRQVLSLDLSKPPVRLLTDYFGAIICIGVMSYLPDVEATCREFCRIARPGAPIVLTQRSDLFQTRGTQAAFDALCNDGLWEQIEVTDARPYLPGNPEFEGIGVHYGVFRRS